MEMSVEFLVKNIYKCYTNADALSRTEGIIWYQEAHLLAKEIAEEFGLTIEQTSLIIAALSPRNSWEKNKTNAYDFIYRISNHYTTFPGMMKTCTDKCASIYYNKDLQTADDRVSFPTFMWETNPLNKASILGSKSYKTKAFARTIFDPRNSHDDVVVDTHAINIANGFWQFRGKEHNKVFSNWEAYELYSKAYRVAAEWLETPVQVVQAVTWCAWRRQLSKYRKSYYESKKGAN